MKKNNNISGFLGSNIEIKAGVGGDESCIFVKELFESYVKMAKKKNWKHKTNEIRDNNKSSASGWSKVNFTVIDPESYEYFKYESGVHRLQRIPTTEAKGRVHTSTVSVVIIPIKKREKKSTIEKKDLLIETYRASGAGGQHVNKTDSAVRITHLPTNIVTTCQDERSQHANKYRAMKKLVDRLENLEKSRESLIKSNIKREQVQESKRSQKIRTYNFVRDQLTDHRVNLKIKNLSNILEKGNLDVVINKIRKMI